MANSFQNPRCINPIGAIHTIYNAQKPHAALISQSCLSSSFASSRSTSNCGHALRASFPEHQVAVAALPSLRLPTILAAQTFPYFIVHLQPCGYACCKACACPFIHSSHSILFILNSIHSIHSSIHAFIQPFIHPQSYVRMNECVYVYVCPCMHACLIHAGSVCTEILSIIVDRSVTTTCVHLFASAIICHDMAP